MCFNADIFLEKILDERLYYFLASSSAKLRLKQTLNSKHGLFNQVHLGGKGEKNIDQFEMVKCG